MIFSHDVKERWDVFGETFEGTFYHNSYKIGSIVGRYCGRELSFMTCHFKANGGPKIGQEIAARAILFGKDIYHGVDSVYKYYALTPSQMDVEDWSGKSFHEPRYDSIYSRLGFKPCFSRQASDLSPMGSRIDNVISLLDESWGHLFYRRRAEALDIDLMALGIDWESAERRWHENYAESRRDIISPQQYHRAVNISRSILG